MKQEIPFIKFLIVILQNKKKLFINIIIIGIVSLITSLLLPKWYKADTLFIMPKSQGLSGLGEIISDFPITFGYDMSQDEEKFITLLNSRQTIDALIDSFHLDRTFEYKYRFLLRKYIRGEIISSQINDDGSIQISVIYPKDPEKPARLANFLVEKIDEFNKKLKSRNAHFQRIFIEENYSTIKHELTTLEDSLVIFQERYGVLDIPEQLKGSIKLISGLQLEKIQTEIALKILQRHYKKDFSEIKILKEKISILNDKIDKLQYETSKRSIFKSFAEIPELSLHYFRMLRDIKIKEKVIEFLIPQLEQARFEEVKNTPSLLVVDPAIPAEYKYKPKRAVIIIISVFFSLVMHIIYIFSSTYINTRKNIDTDFANKLGEIKKLMRLK